jgi:chromosome segregation ATPase
MRKIAVAALLLVASDGLCQTPAKDPDSLQTLLVEVHQLRQAIEAMTLTSQRVQIALYSLQIQDAAVARSSQRLDEARNRCRGEETNRQHTAAEIQRLERFLAENQQQIAGPEIPGASPAAEAKAIEARLPELKTTLEVQTTTVQTCQTAEAEASGGLRNDQAKLAELQDRIERLDKALEQLAGGGK